MDLVVARATAPVALLAALVLLAASACGAEVSTRPKQIDGETLAARANTQLQAQNRQMAKGALSCESVRYEVGAKARCLRTVVLGGGRQVRIGATVTIDRTTDGGHFDVKVDDQPREFGLTGDSVAADLGRQYRAKYGARPTVSCPYLRGVVGQKVTCRLVAGAEQLAVAVTVSSVDRASFDTDYTFRVVP